MPSEQERSRSTDLDLQFADARPEPFFGFGLKISSPAETVGARDTVEQFRLDSLRETPQRAVGDFWPRISAR